MENHAAHNSSGDNNSTTEYLNNEYQPPPKRGRAYAPMGEFDLSLIREFKACPALYDRNSEQFRDKLHSAHQWQEISNKLGFDVSLLKDRMLQLRNRYNLEKRRLEQLRDENPGQHIDSPWPLFDHLHFLSEHIRPRRSYRSMQPRYSSQHDPGADDDEDYTPHPTSHHRQQRYAVKGSGGGGGGVGARERERERERERDSLSDGGGGDSGCGNANVNGGDNYANGMLTVKMEEPDGDDAADIDDVESGSQSGNEDNVRRSTSHTLKLSATSTLLTAQKRKSHSFNMMNTSLDKSASNPTSLALRTRSKHSFANPSSVAQQQPQTSAIKIRRLDTMQERSIHHPQQQQQQRHNNIPHNASNNNQDNNNNHNIDRQRPVNVQQQLPTSLQQRAAFNYQLNRRCLSNSEQKYAAFGEFVTASLLELPAARALQLVEKFTTEMVRVLLDSKTEKIGMSNGIGGGLGGGQHSPKTTPPLLSAGTPAAQQQQQLTEQTFPQMTNGGLITIGINEAVNGL